MKTRITPILRKVFKLVSLLLVSLILSISGIQALHSHKFTIQSEKSADNSDESVSEASSCSLCDCLAHQQNKQLPSIHGTLVVPVITQSIAFQPYSFVGDYEVTSQGFINKGPPVLS